MPAGLWARAGREARRRRAARTAPMSACRFIVSSRAAMFGPWPDSRPGSSPCQDPREGSHTRIDGLADRLVPLPRRAHAAWFSREFSRGESIMAHELISRRKLLTVMGAAGGAAAMVPALARGQAPPPGPATPLSTVTTPPRDFGPNAPPMTFVDPDVITVDPMFNGYRQGNTPIVRLWTGAMWSEGPAWRGQGRYLLWSDIPNNRQMRWSEDDGRVTVFRSPSNNSNGNSFDFQGRQLSCEHLTRRVVRYEHDGTSSVLADNFGGKKLNSPNDVVAHPDGSYWFTDPPYGGQLYEGEPDGAGGASNAGGKLNPRIGQPAGFVPSKRELPTNCYRIDP